MHHVAIMNKSWKLIPKILAGEKTIESRWYQTRRAPWNTIKTGDTIYFKNSGEPVTAQAQVKDVMQFTFSDIQEIEKVIRKYGKQICIINAEPKTWGKLPKYCILVFLEHPKLIPKPFHVNKKGFGNSTAWMVVPDIDIIKR